MDLAEETVVEEVATEEVAEVLDAETIEEAPEVPAEEVSTEEVATEEVVEEATETVEEPVVFDVASPDFDTQIAETLDKYELPQPIQAVIEALQARTPADSFAEYADYGEPEQIKTLLERENLLNSVTEVEPGQYRPNTDKFAESIQSTDPATAAWLYYDLAKLPSDEYKGITKFEEGIVNAFGKEGDTVGAVLARYNQFVDAMKSGAISTDVPDFIPPTLHEAYYDLSKDERNEIALLDPEWVDENGEKSDAVRIEQKLKTLARIQKGIDGDKQSALREAQDKQKTAETFQAAVIDKQIKFYDSFRDTFAKDLAATVVFSTEPAMQKLLANQQVTLLTQAFEEGAAGDFARTTLADAGITFDATEAARLVKAIEAAAVSLTTVQRQVDEKGTALNPVALNKATRDFENAGREWQKFAKDILDQEAKVASTGKAEEIKTEVAKQKVVAKARPATKGTPSAATKTETLPSYGSPEWDKYWATKTLEEQQKRAAAYQ